MSEPFTFLAYEPDGPGLTCAVMVIVEGEHVFGWDTGPANRKLAAAYFMLGYFRICQPINGRTTSCHRAQRAFQSVRNSLGI